jgi:predicted ribosome quality control (RQC) complex YloA/Tae2 family protein
MSDLEKLDQVQGFVDKWVTWAKQNTMLAGFIIAGVPAILGAGYTGITKFNEVKEMYEGYSDTASSASAAERKVKILEERVADQRETIAKMQERLAEALMAAREAKIVAESTQKELRSGLAAQKVELDVTSSTLRSEMNTLKRATTNRLGN